MLQEDPRAMSKSLYIYYQSIWFPYGFAIASLDFPKIKLNLAERAAGIYISISSWTLTLKKLSCRSQYISANAQTARRARSISRNLYKLLVYIHSYHIIHTNTHTHRQTDRQTDRQIDRQTDRQIDRYDIYHYLRLTFPWNQHFVTFFLAVDVPA